MCTLSVAWRLFDDAPVVVGANRDEALDRPARSPHVWDTSPAVLAPRDERAGGTWIGYNEHGLFVALTNRWTHEPSDGDRSRGLLVRDALAKRSAHEAAGYVRREFDGRTYEPCHLFVADHRDAFLFEHDTDRSAAELAPGVYVIVNVGWTGRHRGPADAEAPQTTESFFRPRGGRGPDTGHQQISRARTLRDELEGRSDPDAWLDRASELLGDHDVGACIHGEISESRADSDDSGGGEPPGGFGTRSSSLVRLGADRSYRFANGPPCETPYEPVEPL